MALESQTVFPQRPNGGGAKLALRSGWFAMAMAAMVLWASSAVAQSSEWTTRSVEIRVLVAGEGGPLAGVEVVVGVEHFARLYSRDMPSMQVYQGSDGMPTRPSPPDKHPRSAFDVEHRIVTDADGMAKVYINLPLLKNGRVAGAMEDWMLYATAQPQGYAPGQWQWMLSNELPLDSAVDEPPLIVLRMPLARLGTLGLKVRDARGRPPGPDQVHLGDLNWRNPSSDTKFLEPKSTPKVTRDGDGDWTIAGLAQGWYSLSLSSSTVTPNRQWIAPGAFSMTGTPSLPGEIVPETSLPETRRIMIHHNSTTRTVVWQEQLQSLSLKFETKKGLPVAGMPVLLWQTSVLDSDGGLYHFSGRGSNSIPGKTDEQGRMNFKDLDPGIYRLGIIGDVSSIRPVNPAYLKLDSPNPEASFTLLPDRPHLDLAIPFHDGITVMGQVLSLLDKRPIAGTTVSIHVYGTDGGESKTYESTSDVDGHYRLSDLPLGGRGTYYLRASHPAFEVPAVENCCLQDQTQFEVKADQFEVVQNIKLVPNYPITGRVVRQSDGEPVGEAMVHLLGERYSRQPVATSGDGRFEFRIAAGRLVRFVAQHPDIGTTVGMMLTTPESSLTVPDLRVMHNHSLAGVVLGTDGRPAEGAKVEVRFELTRSDCDIPQEVCLAEVQTGPDGRFQMAGLPSEELKLQALLPGSSGSRIETVMPKRQGTGDPETGITLPLRPGLSFGGTLLGRDGTPAGGLINLTHPDTGRTIQAFTVGQGQFLFEGLPPGEVLAEVQPHGEAASFTIRDLQTGRTDHVIRVPGDSGGK